MNNLKKKGGKPQMAHPLVSQTKQNKAKQASKQKTQQPEKTTMKKENPNSQKQTCFELLS